MSDAGAGATTAIPERPEIVFFDLGDTLVRVVGGWTDIYLSVCREHGLEIDSQALAAALHESAKSGAWDEEGPFEATEAASFARIRAADQAVLDRLGYRDLPDRFFRALEAAFARATAWHVFPDVLPALDALGEAGIRRAVISNWLWSGPELLHNLELARHFEAVVISSRVGYNKPAAEIFRHALDVTGADPERAIHVGDSYRNDVLGARRAGIRPVLIDRPTSDPVRRRAEVPAGDTVPIVSDLTELLALLDLAVDRAAPVQA